MGREPSLVHIGHDHVHAAAAAEPLPSVETSSSSVVQMASVP